MIYIIERINKGGEKEEGVSQISKLFSKSILMNYSLLINNCKINNRFNK